jgi:hypothetical protein
MNLILDNIYGFLYIRQEFHLFLVIYIDCTGIFLIRIDMLRIRIFHMVDPFKI